MDLDRATGWLRSVRIVPSPNFDPRPPEATIDLLVIHGISLPPDEFGGGYIDQLFTNSLDPDQHPYFRDIVHLRVSAHAFIDRTGAITQYVAFHDRAWHAGASSFCGLSCCNDFSIGIELEGCDDRAYEDAQYQALSRLTALLMRHWPGILPDRVVGHSDIAPGRKTDPGPAFDWERFKSMLIGKNNQ
jgi:N-acetyl-anhydromuramoyl-L-alanine amidase